MKKLQNPTKHFFKQLEQIQQKNTSEIDKFVKSLLNKNTCPLCQSDYDTKINIPRILIHCGHTFCTPCLNQFFMKKRIRCPMCLKLIKHIESLQRLPINHTIYRNLYIKQSKNHQMDQTKKISEANQFLLRQFQKVQKQAHIKQQGQKIDEESGLPLCIFHSDRVQHFYCETHENSGCRICIQVGHSTSICDVTDLYHLDQDQLINYQQKMNGFRQKQQSKDKQQKFFLKALKDKYDEQEDLMQDSDSFHLNKSL